MTDVLKATYADLKTVKTRGVCQIVLEMPIEGMADAFSLLGAPIPGNEVWVAVARLRPSVSAVASEPVEIEPHHKPKSLAQIAGIICNEPAFWKYVNVADANAAAEYVRGHCGITSRSALDSNDDAAQAFRTLKADYLIWRDGLAA